MWDEHEDPAGCPRSSLTLEGPKLPSGPAVPCSWGLGLSAVPRTCPHPFPGTLNLWLGTYKGHPALHPRGSIGEGFIYMCVAYICF